MRRRVGGPFRNLEREWHRRGPLARFEQVVADLDPVGFIRKDMGCTRMQAPALRGNEIVIDRLSCEGVPEPKTTRRLPVLGEKLVLNAGGHRSLDGAALLIDKLPQDVGLARPTHNRGRAKYLNLERRKLIESRQDGVSDASGKMQLGNRLAVPAGPRSKNVASIDGILQHLFDHEGVARGACGEQVPKLVANGLPLKDRLYHASDLERIERRQVDDRGFGPAPPVLHQRLQWMAAVKLIATACDQDHDRSSSDSPDEVIDQFAGCAVGPVQVLDHQQAAVGCCRERKQCYHALEQP